MYNVMVVFEEIDFKMKEDHDCSPDKRLQHCAGFLEADMEQNQHRECLETISGDPPVLH